MIGVLCVPQAATAGAMYSRRAARSYSDYLRSLGGNGDARPLGSVLSVDDSERLLAALNKTELQLKVAQERIVELEGQVSRGRE